MNTKARQKITLDFYVDQEASPETLAQRIACVLSSYGSLRSGESVVAPSVKTEYLVCETGVQELVNGKRSHFWSME